MVTSILVFKYYSLLINKSIFPERIKGKCQPWPPKWAHYDGKKVYCIYLISCYYCIQIIIFRSELHCSPSLHRYLSTMPNTWRRYVGNKQPKCISWWAWKIEVSLILNPRECSIKEKKQRLIAYLIRTTMYLVSNVGCACSCSSNLFCLQTWVWVIWKTAQSFLVNGEGGSTFSIFWL